MDCLPLEKVTREEQRATEESAERVWQRERQRVPAVPAEAWQAGPPEPGWLAAGRQKIVGEMEVGRAHISTRSEVEGEMEP